MKESGDYIRQSLGFAFVLPRSGAFQDLIAAIDRAACDRSCAPAQKAPAGSQGRFQPPSALNSNQDSIRRRDQARQQQGAKFCSDER